ncbi:MAG: PhoH family protein [Coriobacteriia bacterium]|nr:PhoH family protein [Coriobacteriia bacterium]
MSTTEILLTIPSTIDMSQIVGVQDVVLREIENQFSAHITVRGNQVHIKGASYEVQTLTSLFSDIIKMVEGGESPTVDYVHHAIELINNSDYTPHNLRDDILLTYRGRAIRPKTAGQKAYTDSIKNNTVTFGIGPAGTGKTYLAMAMAVGALKRKEVGRIVLTRPVVEAGESLGFLPGTLQEKVDPYVRPLYDALFDMTDMEKGNALIESGVIEIAPLAYMRGRTLNDSFVILDEAQNTTPEQMKMFLTRLGFNSKFVITGDITQLDLPHGVSGLKTISTILDGIEGIAFCELGASDVVRHSLVAKIVDAYKGYEQASETRRAKRSFRRSHEGEQEEAQAAPTVPKEAHEESQDKRPLYEL